MNLTELCGGGERAKAKPPRSVSSWDSLFLPSLLAWTSTHYFHLWNCHTFISNSPAGTWRNKTTSCRNSLNISGLRLCQSNFTSGSLLSSQYKILAVCTTLPVHCLLWSGGLVGSQVKGQGSYSEDRPSSRLSSYHWNGLPCVKW